jgi:hypothetical protein
MNSFTRRKFLGDLALASASGFALSTLACKDTPAAPKDLAPANGPLYMILQGPWLLSVEATKLRALTIDPGMASHHFTYYEPRSGSVTNPIHTVQAKEVLSFSTTRPATAPVPNPKQSLSTLLTQKEGLFFDDSKVKLNLTDPSVRQIYFDLPDNILAAGLISGVSFALGGATLNSSVWVWPAALIFIYSNWSSAVLNDSSGKALDSVTAISTISYRKFDIQRQLPVGVNLCQDDSDHATQYFNLLMGQLQFSGGASKPVPTFPPCSNPVKISLGGDSNIKCTDIDPNGPWCTGTTVSGKGPTLVNCAAGHGGVLGCC